MLLFVLILISVLFLIVFMIYFFHLFLFVFFLHDSFSLNNISSNRHQSILCCLKLFPLKSCKLDTPDSEGEILERILKLPPQVLHNKQLFSIAELTEEEDGSQEDPLGRRRKLRPGLSHLHSRGSEALHHAPQPHSHPANPHSLVPPHHRHHSKPVTKEPSVRHNPLQAKPKTLYRVHYADAVSYPENENPSLYEAPTSRRVSAHCPPTLNPNGRERSLLKGLGDRLRRAAMLRSQMAVTAVTNPDQGLITPRTYPVSKTAQTVKSPAGRGMEIDVEYGTDSEEPVDCSGRDAVMEQMSSEWWVEGAQVEHGRSPHRRGAKSEPMVTTEQLQRLCCPTLPPYLCRFNLLNGEQQLTPPLTRQKHVCLHHRCDAVPPVKCLSLLFLLLLLVSCSLIFPDFSPKN